MRRVTGELYSALSASGTSDSYEKHQMQQEKWRREAFFVIILSSLYQRHSARLQRLSLAVIFPLVWRRLYRMAIFYGILRWVFHGCSSPMWALESALPYLLTRSYFALSCLIFPCLDNLFCIAKVFSNVKRLREKPFRQHILFDIEDQSINRVPVGIHGLQR